MHISLKVHLCSFKSNIEEDINSEMTIYLLCPTQAAQSQSTASNTAETLSVLNYTGPETCFNKDDSNSLALKKPLGHTANLWVLNFFCAKN